MLDKCAGEVLTRSGKVWFNLYEVCIVFIFCPNVIESPDGKIEASEWVFWDNMLVLCVVSDGVFAESLGCVVWLTLVLYCVFSIAVDSNLTFWFIKVVMLFDGEISWISTILTGLCTLKVVSIKGDVTTLKLWFVTTVNGNVIAWSVLDKSKFCVMELYVGECFWIVMSLGDDECVWMVMRLNVDECVLTVLSLNIDWWVWVFFSLNIERCAWIVVLLNDDGCVLMVVS